ncbi:hypothetical protein N431DRAFT_103951 [Stipitochalara longipes BDJ]|nr:hypothetical protein N431DRAFT_103951 [Stipitochalara longipes BDJ]
MMSCLLASIFTSSQRKRTFDPLPIDPSSRKRKRRKPRSDRKQSMPVRRTLNTTARGCRRKSIHSGPALYRRKQTRPIQVNTPPHSRKMTSLIICQCRMKPVVTHPRRIQPPTHYRNIRSRAPRSTMRVRARMATRRTRARAFRFLKRTQLSMTFSFPPSEAGKTHASQTKMLKRR